MGTSQSSNTGGGNAAPVWIAVASPAPASTGAPVALCSSAAEPLWSTWPWVNTIRSTPATADRISAADPGAPVSISVTESPSRHTYTCQPLIRSMDS